MGNLGGKSGRKIFVLSGGAGTRLWPLSRESYPKQFYDLTGSGQPLLIDTLSRLENLGQIQIVTTESLRSSTLGILKFFKSPVRVLGEPQAKNTAAAIALATYLAVQDNPESVIGVFPADHLIANKKRFAELLEFGFDEVEKHSYVIALGIHPTYPSDAYGYMEVDEAPDYSKPQALKVRRFIEKPNIARAEELIKGSPVVWNAGMFLFKASTMKALFQKHLPKLWHSFEKLKADHSNLAEIYSGLESQSIDFGIMEKVKDIRCIPADIGWTDIGSWEEVARRGQSRGRPVEISCQGNFYAGLTPEKKRVAFLGVDDLVVVDTPDALLIVKKGEGQKVREVVAQLSKEGESVLLKSHSFEDRPWGRFEILSDTDHYKSKRISVWPGQKLSYQSHERRSENWVIVKGTAEVTLNDVKKILRVGESIFIPAEAKHRIANPTTEVMEFIEVQTGTYFGEDDIHRYSDDYGRS